jgi:hypothetical protein
MMDIHKSQHAHAYNKGYAIKIVRNVMQHYVSHKHESNWCVNSRGLADMFAWNAMLSSSPQAYSVVYLF